MSKYNDCVLAYYIVKFANKHYPELVSTCMLRAYCTEDAIEKGFKMVDEDTFTEVVSCEIMPADVDGTECPVERTRRELAHELQQTPMDVRLIGYLQGKLNRQITQFDI